MTEYHALLAALAIPRLVGTANHAKVRDVLKRELAARGFAVEEHAFTARPSPILLGTPRLVRGVNLVGVPPSGRPPIRPPVWLVAHYDSKGQPISMALRLCGAGALVAGLAAAAFVPLVGVVLAAAGLLVLANNRVTDRSPGAVDNAAALVAVFMIVDALRGGGQPRDVGVIFPDCEELGLLGAGALLNERPELLRDAVVLNFDGLDDRGRATVVLHRAGPVGRAVARAVGARALPWMPVVVDGIKLARAAQECVTIMKGGWHTARIVHTPADTAQRLTLAGARAVAEGVARVLTEP